jgi:translation initiation factor 4E
MSAGSELTLHQKWVVWFDNPRLAPEASDWKDNLKKCGDFDTVSCFWSLFNNLKPASKLPLNSNYHVFRDGVEPMWEDPANKKGGKFVLTIPKKDSRAGRCDEWWLYTVLALIGETIDLNGDQVCGAVVSIRKSQDRIALWLKSADQQVCSEIGARWKKALDMNKTVMKYQLHDDGTSTTTFSLAEREREGLNSACILTRFSLLGSGRKWKFLQECH